MLHVHRAERADALADGLGELLSHPLPDPFAAEVVAVPAKGVERWLAQRLSHRLGATGTPGDERSGSGPDGGLDGVCAGVQFPSPGSVVAGAIGAATGIDSDDDPWRPERSVWPLLEVVDEAAGQPWCAALGGHVQRHRGRRYATARHLAELFADYAAHRPEMLDDWLAGADGINGADPDGAGTDGVRTDGAGADGATAAGGPAADLAWQPELWRRLRARIGRPGPAEQLATACAALRTGPGAVALPGRLSVFGPTRLPAAHLAVLVALAEHRDVHLWLPHPSPVLWTAVQALPHTTPHTAPGDAVRSRVPRRRTDPGADAPRHPLLSSLGRDVRELQVRLAAAAPDRVDHHHRPPDPPDTLLGRLQRELREDAPPVAAHPQAPADRSVQVHSCHGPDRQVEVLREVVLGLLRDDPTLEPRDVLVMCPDIEAFAPLVSAAFGHGEDADPDLAGATGHPGHPGHRLRVRLADRALRQVNPLLDTVAQLLDLAGARATASQLLDLLGSPPVRRRFRLDTDDVDRITDLVVRSGVRWGLDSAHRTPFKLDGFPQNTWSAGLDRLLLGVTMAGGGPGANDGPQWLGTALPLDEVDSGDITRIGRLAEFVDRLAAVLDALRATQPLTGWVRVLIDALDALTDTVDADAWQAAQARGELAEAARAAGPHAGTVPLGPAEVRGLLDERLRGRPTRANFRTGSLTVATLVPMRSVPHRVVCLLGLDDGAFPRAGVADGDDLLARDPLVGERDPRSEDRQLLLDAICAAGEHLVVVHSGADERTGARRPPAVPLGELLDAVAATAGPDGLDRVLVRHPLQPFDRRNFTPGGLGRPGPFSFDTAELAGARAAAGPATPAAPFLAAPLGPVPHAPVALDDLVTFLEHPVKGFLRQRVGLSLFTGDDQPADALPVDPDGLGRWAVGDRLLRDRLAGHSLDRCRQAEWRRGELPPGALGQTMLLNLLDEVEALVAAAAGYPAAPGRPTDQDIDVELSDGELPGGGRVVGTVGGLRGSVLLRVEYSRLAAKHRIRAWVRLLALTASTGGTGSTGGIGPTGEPWTAVTLGRGSGHRLSKASVGPLDPATARTVLADLVALHRDGLRAPLPLPTVAGSVYAGVRRGGADPAAALAEAARKWDGGAGAERRDPAHARVWGEAAGAVLTEPAPDAGSEPTRFGALARRLWYPMLAAEDVVRL